MSPVEDGDVRPGRALYDNANPRLDQVDSESSPRLLFLHTWVQTQRLLIRWRHDIQTVIQALILPPMFLVSMDLVFGKPVSSASGHSALYGSVPMAALVGAIFGSTASGICLMREREEGLLARFWVLPVNRASGLLARLVAEAARILVTTVLVVCTGVVLGFRYEQGILAALAWVAVPLAFGVAFSFLVITMAMYLVNTVLVEATGIAVTLLIYFCTGFVPLAEYPSWIQPVVHHQPMSNAVDAMRGFSLGGPVLAPMIGTLLWSVGIVAVCAAPMVIGYRRASSAAALAVAYRAAARQHAVRGVGGSPGGLRSDQLINLDGDVVVDVDLAVHAGRVRPANRYLHAGFRRIGQHSVGLECLAGHRAQVDAVGLVVADHENSLATRGHPVDPCDVGHIVQVGRRGCRS